MFRFRKKGAKLDMFYSSIIAFLPLKDVQVIYKVQKIGGDPNINPFVLIEFGLHIAQLRSSEIASHLSVIPVFNMVVPTSNNYSSLI